MDEAATVFAVVGITGTAVAAFWLRTESVKESVLDWVQKNYMSRELVAEKLQSLGILCGP